jgi:phage terminase large subunit-like protein
MLTLRPYQFCDLALKSEKDPGVKMNPDGSVRADYFVDATASRTGPLVYLLDLYRAQIPFPEQVRAIAREHHQWKSVKIGVEDVAYQWALGQACWEQGLPVVPVPVPGDKVFKAQLATPHFETGRVRIRGVKENGVLVPHPALRRFVKEALDFPFGEADDTVDAVVGVVLMCTSEEFIGKEYHGSMTKGFGIAIAGGTGRIHRGDPYDVFRSVYM